MDFLYIFKKIGILVLLFIAAAILVIGRFTSFPLYFFFDAYFRFGLYVVVIGIISHFFPLILPKKYNVEEGFFASRRWEKNGKFYDEKFRVMAWKDSAMDAAKIFAGRKSETEGTVSGNTAGKAKETPAGGSDAASSVRIFRDTNKLSEIIQGTCVSELVHWILILLSPALLFLIRNPLRWLFWALYLFFNLKDVVIQRYNRPRFRMLYNRASGMERKRRAAGPSGEAKAEDTLTGQQV